MPKPASKQQNEEPTLAEAMGASDETSVQVLTLYIPNKDRHNAEFGHQRKWVLEAAGLLARIGGGVTIMPPAEGGWVDHAGGIIWESPVIVYSFVKPKLFSVSVPALREFLHRMGRETNQGEVAFEFDGWFYRITEFDQP
ncbi:hypothetical protein AUK22_11485 [bacterium CG2_30_54_10]|nr:MAG: hypothetical protein AUK22_11485 [bacterium CG2_30_54_10]